MIFFKKGLKRIYQLAPWGIKDRVGFYYTFRCFPNIRNPQTFNEKVLYRKRHACVSDNSYPLLADKYLVRNYVAEKIGEKYLIPLYNKYDNIAELKNDIRNYSRFVLKPNHGAGMVKIIDSIRSNEELADVINTAQKWIETDFSKVLGEKHYSKIKRNFLIEERIGNEGTFLVDYKVHLFKNENDEFFFVLQIIDDRFIGALNRTFYVNDLDVIYSGGHELDTEHKLKLKEAIELSKALISDLEYVRVDWYICDDKLYFGEITLTPARGIGSGYGNELDLLMGSKWNLKLAPR